MKCPCCNAELDAREMRSLAQSEISRSQNKSTTPEETRDHRLEMLRRRSNKKITPGSWYFEIFGTGMRIGSYATRKKCTNEIRRLQKVFPEYKFVLHDPFGNVYVPKRRSDGETRFQFLTNKAKFAA